MYTQQEKVKSAEKVMAQLTDLFNSEFHLLTHTASK